MCRNVWQWKLCFLSRGSHLCASRPGVHVLCSINQPCLYNALKQSLPSETSRVKAGSYFYSSARAVIIKDHRVGGLTEIYFLILLGLEVWEQGAGRFFSEASLLGLRTTVFSLCPYMVSPCVMCPNLLFSEGHQSYRIRAQLNDLILT